ncbi:MAG TPA: hypothetical protein VFX64_02210 [Candidatus Nitrosotalea sp.]|nr:hypothetical protein [Candidatus Nitrosotalea sp.]
MNCVIPDMQQFIKSQESFPYDKVREVLVCTILEKTLVSAGVYNTITSEIEKRYNCSMQDCYNHPEYLSSILEDKCGDMYDMVSESITKQLEMFSHEKSIAKFLQIINS